MEAVIENGQVTNIIVGHLENSLPLVDEMPNINEYQTIDGFTYDIQADKVVKVYNIIDKPLSDIKASKAQQAKASINELAPVTVNGITYNGGDSSASAIAGAIQLATELGETEVRLWDINNVIATYTFEEAMAISAQIAKAYRDKQFAKYEKIAQINTCETLEELDAIEIVN